MPGKTVTIRGLRLTKTVVDGLSLPEGAAQLLAYDRDHRHLGVRVGPRGSSWFYVASVGGGKMVRREIAPANSIGLAEAARRADVARGEVAAGRDPAEAVRSRQRAALTVGDALTAYLEAGGARGSLAPRTRADYRGLLDLELAAIADRRLVDITHAAAKSLLLSVTAEHGMSRARYALRLLAALASANGLPNPLRDPDAPRRVALGAAYKPSIKAPRLSPAQARTVWRAATAELPATALLSFCLLTGCRVGEARTLGREDVDLAAATVMFRETKNGRDFTVQLPRQAVEILRPQVKEKTGLVFDGDGRAGLIRVKKAMGLRFGFHDLRKLFAQVAVEVGVPHAVLVGMLNHSTSGSVTLAHYAKPSGAALRAGWQAVADYVTGRGVRSDHRK